MKIRQGTQEQNQEIIGCGNKKCKNACSPKSTKKRMRQAKRAEKHERDEGFQTQHQTNNLLEQGHGRLSASGLFTPHQTLITEDVRNEKLTTIQDSIIERYGNINITSRNMKVNYFGSEEFKPSHMFKVVKGNGFTLARVNEDKCCGPKGHKPENGSYKDPYEPDLLFYAPKSYLENPNNPDFKNNEFTNFWPDGEYVLIGWGYYAHYDPENTPIIGDLQVPEEEFFFHEAGFHLLNGGFLMTAPEEDITGISHAGKPKLKNHLGQVIKSVLKGGIPMASHDRVWDLHYWRTDLMTGENSSPVAAIRVPEEFNYLPEDDAIDLMAGFTYPDLQKIKDQHNMPAITHLSSRETHSHSEHQHEH